MLATKTSSATLTLVRVLFSLGLTVESRELVAVSQET
jgi:hypothetical protein